MEVWTSRGCWSRFENKWREGEGGLGFWSAEWGRRESLILRDSATSIIMTIVDKTIL